ncbi:RNA polymerase sigma-70 factor [Nocardioides caldifontis]|uniref:RNA polymerase sigma-70 factor n=1 Tax=Nocardioides caldifontis TaxID=2588938 RepID=UPI001939E892|nr:RNA polymerase sigma-70 factor [Nocardioides caldifontis]
MSSDPYLDHRNLLFTVAYEMLGSAADAEDVLQESWVKWSQVDRSAVRDPRSYLVRIVTRTALDRLRTVARRREEYVGPWLPEPLLTAPDVAEDAELADSLSTAMLLVLETLTPTERAVFLLREVFELGYDELAEAVGKSEPAVRQIASRARAHVAARRPRAAATRAETARALEAFLHALETGDLQPLVDLLAPDVVALGDGGGVKQALPRPVVGADKVAALMRVGVRGVRELGMTGSLVEVNGWPAVLVRVGDEVDAVVTLRVEDGLVSGIYTVRNPEKLSGVLEVATLAR